MAALLQWILKGWQGVPILCLSTGFLPPLAIHSSSLIVLCLPIYQYNLAQMHNVLVLCPE